MAADGLCAARQTRGLLKTTVRILRGSGRGRIGLIAGALDSQNPNVSRVPVFCAGDVVIAKLADLAETAAQPEPQQLPLFASLAAQGRRF